MQPMVRLRAPKIFNVRSDPFERSEHEAGAYDQWFIDHLFVLVPAQAIVGQYLKSFLRPASIVAGAHKVKEKWGKLTGTREWMKIKASQAQEVVIVGFTAPRSRQYFGSLVLAVREGSGWRYVGRVGRGFDHATLKSLHAKLVPLITDSKRTRLRRLLV